MVRDSLLVSQSFLRAASPWLKSTYGRLDCDPAHPKSDHFVNVPGAYWETSGASIGAAMTGKF